MHSAVVLCPFLLVSLSVSLVQAKFYRPFQYDLYKAGPSQHHEAGKPTSRHKNHCAYVVEKTVSFSVQDGAAPYVKAEYNKCSWGQKCPTLLYRIMYKPLYKVAHKTLTELEWRCCPGYSGYGCMEGPPVYYNAVKSMPPFKGAQVKGPQFKGPQFKGPPPFKGPLVKGPQFKGPVFKGPVFKGPQMKGPQFKGPPVHHGVQAANPWHRPHGPPHMGHMGPPMSNPYPETSFEPYPSEPEPIPEHQEPEPHHAEQEGGHEHEHEHGHHHEPEEQHIPEETAPPSGGEEIEGHALDSETQDRLDQMEEDVRRLNQGLETLRGTVTGLEDGLRASLREDANRMLSALLSAAPGPVPAPALASSSHSSVGFGDIPGGNPEAEGGLDGAHVFPGLGELTGRVEELRADLRAKTSELRELRATVLGHDGALARLSGGAAARAEAGGGGSAENDTRRAAEALVESKLSGARSEILSGFERRVESAEGRCEEKAGEVRRQCQRERGEGQAQMEEALAGSAAALRREMGDLRAKLHGLEDTESCCGRMAGLAERVHQLEQSTAGLNQSQGHLRAALGAHRDHIEGMLEGRLGYVEDKLNLSGKASGNQTAQSGGGGVQRDGGEGGGWQGLDARLEGRLRALEARLQTAVEEVGNGTTPALLEGHAVPTMESELEALRGRLEMDVDRVQKHLSRLELRCTSSCSSSPSSSSSSSSSPTPSALQGDAASIDLVAEEEENVMGMLDTQADRLNSLNVTLQGLLQQLREHQEEEGEEPGIQGELTILKFNVRSVNRTLRGLQDSVGTVVHQVGQANSTWQEREARLAQQMKGVVQLVGRQASMLGAGERRLTRLKGELQEMRRRLAGEVQGCRSTALGVKKEVIEVGGRVANVEDQCKGLNHMAEDLERIREELERQSDGLLSQVNGTLTSHAQQLTELKDGLRNCTSKVEPTSQSLEAEPELRRGDTFTLI